MEKDGVKYTDIQTSTVSKYSLHTIKTDLTITADNTAFINNVKISAHSNVFAVNYKINFKTCICLMGQTDGQTDTHQKKSFITV